jgi:hypothetical protein
MFIHKAMNMNVGDEGQIGEGMELRLRGVDSILP